LVTNPWAGGAAATGSEIPSRSRTTNIKTIMNGNRVFIEKNYISKALMKN
jgi:hypothetical protein